MVQADIVTETVTLFNKGRAALEQVHLRLEETDGTPAPDWVHLGVGPDTGDIAIGRRGYKGSPSFAPVCQTEIIVQNVFCCS